METINIDELIEVAITLDQKAVDLLKILKGRCIVLYAPPTPNGYVITGGHFIQTTNNLNDIPYPIKRTFTFKDWMNTTGAAGQVETFTNK